MSLPSSLRPTAQKLQLDVELTAEHLNTMVYSKRQTKLLKGVDERPDAPFTAALMAYECAHNGRAAEFENLSPASLATTNVMGILLTYFTVTLVDVASGASTEMSTSRRGKAGYLYLDMATGAALVSQDVAPSVPMCLFLNAIAMHRKFTSSFMLCAVASEPLAFASFLGSDEATMTYASSSAEAMSHRGDDPEVANDPSGGAAHGSSVGCTDVGPGAMAAASSTPADIARVMPDEAGSPGAVEFQHAELECANVSRAGARSKALTPESDVEGQVAANASSVPAVALSPPSDAMALPVAVSSGLPLADAGAAQAATSVPSPETVEATSEATPRDERGVSSTHEGTISHDSVGCMELRSEDTEGEESSVEDIGPEDPMAFALAHARRRDGVYQTALHHAEAVEGLATSSNPGVNYTIATLDGRCVINDIGKTPVRRPKKKRVATPLLTNRDIVRGEAPIKTVPLSKCIGAIWQAVVEARQTGRAILVDAGTASGKTAVVAATLRHYDCGSRVLQTLPKKILAERQHQHAGEQTRDNVDASTAVAYAHGDGRDGLGGRTKLLHATPGWVMAHLGGHDGRRLSRDDCDFLIVDELHEFNINAEVLLERIDTSDPPIVIGMSATMPSQLPRVFDDPIIVKCEGCHYSQTRIVAHDALTSCLTAIYLDKGRNINQWKELGGQLACATIRQWTGDALVFAPGEAEINAVIDGFMASPPPRTTAVKSTSKQPLWSPAGDSRGRKRLIVSTNVLESGETLSMLDWVIVPGIHRAPAQTLYEGPQHTDSEIISKASYVQQIGRAARVRPGFYTSILGQVGYELGDDMARRLTKEDLVTVATTPEAGDAPLLHCFNSVDFSHSGAAWTRARLLNAVAHVNHIGLKRHRAAITACKFDKGKQLWGEACAALGCSGALYSMLAASHLGRKFEESFLLCDEARLTLAGPEGLLCDFYAAHSLGVPDSRTLAHVTRHCNGHAATTLGDHHALVTGVMNASTTNGLLQRSALDLSLWLGVIAGDIKVVEPDAATYDTKSFEACILTSNGVKAVNVRICSAGTLERLRAQRVQKFIALVELEAGEYVARRIGPANDALVAAHANPFLADERQYLAAITAEFDTSGHTITQLASLVATEQRVTWHHEATGEFCYGQ